MGGGRGGGCVMQIGEQIRLKKSRDRMDYDCVKLGNRDKTLRKILVEIYSLCT